MFAKQIYVKPAVREIALTAGAWRICSGSIEEYYGNTDLGEYDGDSD